MTSVAVLIPVLNRPERAAVIAENIRATEERATPVFICSPGDTAEIAACAETSERTLVVTWEPGRGDWARKLNFAFGMTSDEWKLLGADDLRFYPGWFDACLKAATRVRACVVGTNDLGNSRVLAGNHSTHPLVHRDYMECGTADEDGKILHEGYTHQFTDDEFCQTAMVRRTFAFAREAHVEHLHPHWAKGKWDATYERGQAGFSEDRLLYERRKHLWLGR